MTSKRLAIASQLRDKNRRGGMTMAEILAVNLRTICGFAGPYEGKGWFGFREVADTISIAWVNIVRS